MRTRIEDRIGVRNLSLDDRHMASSAAPISNGGSMHPISGSTKRLTTAPRRRYAVALAIVGIGDTDESPINCAGTGLRQFPLGLP